MNRHFVTPSGTTGHVETGQVTGVQHRDALAIPFEISSSGTQVTGTVIFDAPALLAGLLRQNYGIDVNTGYKDELAYLAVLHAIDSDPSFFQGLAPYELEIGAGNVEAYLDRPRLTDRELRRFISRKVYDEYSRSDLDALVGFDELDSRVAGATPQDFQRNCQVLESEEYLRMHRAMGIGNFHVQATARLVRDIERYGSTRADVQAREDYTAVVRGNAVLSPYADAILLEYGRFASAATQEELASVFRATAPVVEEVLRSVLRQKGIARDFPSLGPMIREMQNHGLGGIYLLSQLNHVLKFARDLEQHGGRLADSALRIAAANAFELLPQIAAL